MYHVNCIVTKNYPEASCNRVLNKIDLLGKTIYKTCKIEIETC